MAIGYRSHSFDDARARPSSERCTNRTFGVDLGLWRRRGPWDERCTALSAIEDGECFVSFSVYIASMMALKVGLGRISPSAIASSGR